MINDSKYVMLLASAKAIRGFSHRNAIESLIMSGDNNATQTIADRDAPEEDYESLLKGSIGTLLSERGEYSRHVHNWFDKHGIRA